MVTLSFSGTVASVSNATSGVLVGDSISGSVVYDQTQAGTAGNYVFTGSGKVHTFNWTATRSGVQVFADSFMTGPTSPFTITVRFNVQVGGVYGTTLEVKAPGLSGKTALDLVMFDAGNLGMSSAQLLPTQAISANFAIQAAGV